MIQFLSSLLPALLLLAFIYWKDKNREPLPMVMKGVWYGFLCVWIAVLLELPLEFLYRQLLKGIPVVGPAFRGFIVAAVPEESAKLLMLWLLLRKNKEFDEYLDGIVYAVAIGLGFAAFENITYVFGAQESWTGVAISRALLAVPGHYAFAVLMGFFYSLYHFLPHQYAKSRYLILLLPVIAHGIYDMLLFICMESGNAVRVVILIMLIVFVVRMHKYCYKRIGILAQLDQDKVHTGKFILAMNQE